MMKHIFSKLFLAMFVGAVATLASCSEQDSGRDGNSVHQMRGIIREIRPTDSTVVIEHEDVPGFMPAMTMPFNLRSGENSEKLAPGQAIEFELVTNEDDSWIRNIRKIDVSSLNLPEGKKTAPSTGKDSKPARLEEGDLLPEFQLTDQDGKTINRETFAGKDLVVTFIFTRCPVPDFCPRMSRQFAEIEKVVSGDPGLADRVRLLSISFDPEYDTPEILEKYAAEHSKNLELWRFASGSVSQTKDLTHVFAVYTETEGGTINHGLTTAWIGPDGTVRKLWRGNAWKPEEVLDALK